MPFGRYKGCRIRLLPDSYLSWLTEFKPLYLPEWNWLRESVIAELKFRGMRHDLAPTIEPESPPEPYRKPKRAIRLE